MQKSGKRAGPAQPGGVCGSPLPALFTARSATPLMPACCIPELKRRKKIGSIAEVKDGASTAIPNDPSNAARGLQLLEKAGLAKLKPEAGTKATVFDIAENPKHLQIKELDAAQLPRAPDDLVFSVVSQTYAINAGLDPKKALLLEDDQTKWNLVFATRSKDKESPVIKRFVEIYRSVEVKDSSRSASRARSKPPGK
jgi:D-methionine transport system substrate-binding protein